MVGRGAVPRSACEGSISAHHGRHIRRVSAGPREDEQEVSKLMVRVANLFYAVEPTNLTFWAMEFPAQLLLPFATDMMTGVGSILMSNLVEECVLRETNKPKPRPKSVFGAGANAKSDTSNPSRAACSRLPRRRPSPSPCAYPPTCNNNARVQRAISGPGSVRDFGLLLPGASSVSRTLPQQQKKWLGRLRLMKTLMLMLILQARSSWLLPCARWDWRKTSRSSSVSDDNDDPQRPRVQISPTHRPRLRPRKHHRRSTRRSMGDDGWNTIG